MAFITQEELERLKNIEEKLGLLQMDVGGLADTIEERYWELPEEKRRSLYASMEEILYDRLDTLRYHIDHAYDGAGYLACKDIWEDISEKNNA